MELLISSNICRYVEFRAVDRVATLLNDELKPIPCSRSDVFTTNEVSVVEKRLLMKLLSSCLDEANENEAEFKSMQFLSSDLLTKINCTWCCCCSI